MLLGWTRSHNSGSKITLQINDEDLEHFERMTVRKGKIAGQRLMAVFVELGDDEQPIQHGPAVVPRSTGNKFPDGLTGLSVRWCQDSHFHDWLAINHPAEWHTASAEREKTWQGRCAVVVKMLCGVESRKQLDTDPFAREEFDRLIRLPYAKARKDAGLE
jgi:hypothetical protein